VTRGKKVGAAWAIILASVGAVGVAFYFIYAAQRDAVVVDEHLCPLNRLIVGHTIVAADWTDPFTAQQRDALRDVMNRLKREIPVHARLSIHLITGDPERAGVPIFSFCKPLDPDHINPLIETEKRLRDKWNEQFGKPLDSALTELLKGSVSPTSPILEAIDIILWNHNFQEDLPYRELVIFSDLLQNTPEQNHYKFIPNPCDVVNTPLGQRLKARNWKNLRIVFYYWRNPDAPKIQGPAHLSFWTRLFFLLGANEIRVGPALIPRNPDALKCDVSNLNQKKERGSGPQPRAKTLHEPPFNSSQPSSDPWQTFR
jgi:hypothetical protein